MLAQRRRAGSLSLRARAGWLVDSALGYLPRGDLITQDVWHRRHLGILVLVWLQAGALALFAWFQGYPLDHSALEGTIVLAAPAIVEALRIRNRTVRSTAASAGLITASAVLTHLSGGHIEAHFHFFIMLAVIALYQAWVPFLVSIVYVLLHHGIAGTVDPSSVFNHTDAIAHPWKWAMIHAGAVSAACALYVLAWRWNELALEHTQHILDAAGEGIIGLNAEGAVLFVNPKGERITGWRARELLRTPLDSIIRPLDLASLGDAPEHQTTEGSITLRNGATIAGEFERTVIRDRGRTTGEVVTFRDITERKQAEEARLQIEQRFRSLVQNASDLITVVDADTLVLYQSPSVQRVLGRPAESVVGTQLTSLLHADDVQRFTGFLTDFVGAHGAVAALDARFLDGDDAWHYCEIIATDRRTDPAVGGFVLNIRDVSERKALEDQLRYQAFHDPLTGLANRARFGDRLEHALLRATRTQSIVSVLFMDLDNFKSVNDGLGHSAGDRLLIEVANRAQACLRPGDTAARFGGDEFAILLEDLDDEGEAAAVAERLIEAMRIPLSFDGKELFIRASIGVASSRGHALHQIEPDEIFRNADTAMYAAKAAGKGRYAVYDQRMHVSLSDRLELLADLQLALERDEFIVQYQPTVVLGTERIVGVEALVRWRHPKRGVIQPAAFIGLAEECGVILGLGRQVLERACRQTKQWQDEYPNSSDMTVSVNVSVRQLQEPAFVGEVARALEESGLTPECLVLEITESVMMRDAPATTVVLGQLKRLGVRLAIDDFGTGYSSLSYLRQFPIDILKIDKSFVDGAGDTEKEQKLTRAIVDLAKTLQLDVVAEGIERVEQLARLRSLDCTFGQGFYFAEPRDADEIGELLKTADQESPAA